MKLFTVVVALVLLACRSPGASVAEGPSCEERKTRLLSVLQALPAQGRSASVEVDLPMSTFMGAPTNGPVLEIDEPAVRLDTRAVTGKTRAARVAQLAELLGRIERGQDEALLVAAAHDTDMRSLHDYLRVVPEAMPLRLLFNAPPIGEEENADSLGQQLHLADRVLAETDPAERRKLLRRGYDEFSTCPEVTRVVNAVDELGVRQRWAALRPRMQRAVERCACEQLQPDGLRRLLVAEQRAGTVGLGSVTANYLRDWRCRASMPLRSVQQLLGDIEEFDSEFSGDWQRDALVFEQVVTDDRLLVYLCQAMPGDVLSSLQRQAWAMYWKLPGHGSCQAWRFEPLAAGAPMGTWRRLAESNREALAFHYRQAANDIRLFGPVTDPESLPTDVHEWQCDQDLHMESVDESSIGLTDGGRWFLTREACEAASGRSAHFGGCVAEWASGRGTPRAAEP